MKFAILTTHRLSTLTWPCSLTSVPLQDLSITRADLCAHPRPAPTTRLLSLLTAVREPGLQAPTWSHSAYVFAAGWCH